MSGSSLMIHKKPDAMPATSTLNDMCAPLDYSFYHLSNVADVCSEEPRPSIRKEYAATKEVESGKSLSRCLRLNNNNLAEITSLPEVASSLFFNPSALGWIDLSYNELPNIDEVLLTFENLEILYLHGNLITELKEVDKLQNLRCLRKLTLHGNELDKVKGYKWYVLSLMPNLQNFDFCAVTKADRRTAATLQKFNQGAQRKTVTEKEDD